jgi:hypothetical protein
VTAPTPEQRAAWRERIERLHELARGHDYAAANELAAGSEAIEDVFDALGAAEREREGYRERAIAYAKATDDYQARARRAEAALARVEALAGETAQYVWTADIRRALNPDD